MKIKHLILFLSLLFVTFDGNSMSKNDSELCYLVDSLDLYGPIIQVKSGFTVAAQSAERDVYENVVPVEIEGVYILSFDKDDVIECNRPSVGCFDYPQKNYFFTLSVNGKIHLKSFNDIRMALLNPEYANLEVFSFPPFNYYSDSILKAQNITQQTQSVSLGKEYYLLDGDSTNLYKYMHIKASALRTIVFSDYLDKNRIPDLQTLFDINTAASIDLNDTCIYNYILYDIEIIDESLPEWLTAVEELMIDEKSLE